MEKDAKIYVAGHRGMEGSAIVRELQRQDVSLRLSLAAFATYRVTIDKHLKVVTVGAMQTVPHSPVPEPVALNHVKQWATLAMRHVAQ